MTHGYSNILPQQNTSISSVFSPVAITFTIRNIYVVSLKSFKVNMYTVTKYRALFK